MTENHSPMNTKLKNGQYLRIVELYAFVAKDKDGHEGIMGFKNGDQWFPMIGADIDRVDSLIPIADKISAVTGQQYEIRYFVPKSSQKSV